MLLCLGVLLNTRGELLDDVAALFASTSPSSSGAMQADELYNLPSSVAAQDARGASWNVNLVTIEQVSAAASDTDTTATQPVAPVAYEGLLRGDNAAWLHGAVSTGASHPSLQPLDEAHVANDAKARTVSDFKKKYLCQAVTPSFAYFNCNKYVY